MTEEQFTQLGLTQEQAKKAAAESAKELESYIPKHRFDEVNEENKSLKNTVKENEAALEELKKTVGSSDELKSQIEKLQAEAKEKEEKYQSDLKETKMTNAIMLAINGKAQDDELVAGLIDRSKLLLSDDGKITGLDEQIKTLKESKAFLFKEDEPNRPGFRKLGGDPPRNQEQGGNVDLRSAIAAKMNV